MGNLTYALLFVMTVNVLVWFSSTAMLDINPTGASCVYDSSGTALNDMTTGSGNNIALKSNASGMLPDSSSSNTVSGSTGITFLDVLSNTLTWIKEKGKMLLSIVTAPVSILTCVGLPTIFVVGISLIWYAITILLIVAFILGRGD